ncbi:hypothetical protein [Labilithrix luteola]|uniref:phage adaptor protein n=1 Tax=Labilithrix luteola TaxID=1391654 RepID=UPI0011BA9307|nr:hypothetical protein [Labilithrix luteola]
MTLADLKARALQRANLEGATQFITSDELTDIVNGSIAEWCDEVRQTTWNGTYSRSSYSFTTSGNQKTYALPADFLSMISVDLFATFGAAPVAIYAFQEEQRNRFNAGPFSTGFGFSCPAYYQIQGQNIALIPLPAGAYQVTLNYVPTAPRLTDPDDTLDSINGWEEFIVLDAAIKCLIKAGEHETIQLLEGRLSAQRERIRAMASRRDQQTAEQVHVIANRDFFYEWEW